MPDGEKTQLIHEEMRQKKSFFCSRHEPVVFFKINRETFVLKIIWTGVKQFYLWLSLFYPKLRQMNQEEPKIINLNNYRQLN